MSMTRFGATAALAAATFALCVSPARAQNADGQPDRFFSDKVGEAEARGEAPTNTLLQGSVTSTTFAYTELGNEIEGVEPNLADNYSPAQRLFTDLRTQLDAKHISGSTWDMRMDARVRLNRACTFLTPDQSNRPNQVDQLYDTCRTQSGLLGGNEYEARELYARRAGQKSDWYIGRQYVLELAATKIDGVKFAYHQSDKWDLLAFGGLYPARGSRSIETDYPARQLPDMEEGARILPVAAGLGGSYRYQDIYGSLGAVGILPMAEDRATGANEVPRVFVTGNGYWRQSRKLDIYHYLVVDLQNADGQGLTNLSLGVNYRPVPSMRVTAGVNRVDTETLNVIAQNYLADPNDADAGVTLPRNDLEVLRIASQSARLGVSVALADNRFEISTSGQVRHRPDITLYNTDGDVQTEIPASRAAEVLVSVVDRRSWAGFRLGASVMRIMGIGGVNYNRSQATVVRLDGAREISDGKGQVEANVSVISSADDNQADNCDLDPLNCYGTSSVLSLSAGGTVFYRVGANWFVVGNASVGRQTLSNYVDATQYNQPANLLISGFARLAYRF